MDRRVFPIRTYVTLTWQVLLFSLAATLLLDRFIESRLIWALSTPLPALFLKNQQPFPESTLHVSGPA